MQNRNTAKGRSQYLPFLFSPWSFQQTEKSACSSGRFRNRRSLSDLRSFPFSVKGLYALKNHQYLNIFDELIKWIFI
ncbi:hypothetical protein CDG61_04725 [Acinetobacter sp. WCHAc010052]|nr:hypothetical protein CDG61_04725 [Acinetobacter sp. WCHAc010052]